jgi:hypothetical protein
MVLANLVLTRRWLGEQSLLLAARAPLGDRCSSRRRWSARRRSSKGTRSSSGVAPEGRGRLCAPGRRRVEAERGTAESERMDVMPYGRRRAYRAL